MATPPFNINELLPQSSDLISQHPTNARAFRDIVESWLNVLSDPSTGQLRTEAFPTTLALNGKTLAAVKITGGELNGTLGVTTPAAAHVTTLSASGAVTLSSTLAVTGAVTTSASIQSATNIQVTGLTSAFRQATASRSLIVSMAGGGSAQLILRPNESDTTQDTIIGQQGNMTVGGNVSAVDLVLTGDATIGDDLIVTGESLFSGAMLGNSGLWLTAANSIAGGGLGFDSLTAPDTFATRRIAWDDGGIGFGLRAGSYYGTGANRYTTTSSGAAEVYLNHTSAQGSVNFRVATTGTADAAISYNNTMTLTNLGLTLSQGDITVSNGGLVADGFSGPGDDLTDLNADELTSGTIPNGRLGGNYSAIGSLSAVGNVETTTGNFIGNGSLITDLDADAISLGTVAAARLPLATASQVRSKTASVLETPSVVMAAAARVNLTDAASIAVDMNTFVNAIVTIAGNRTLANPTNVTEGQRGTIVVAASGATRTIDKASNYFSTTAFPVSITAGERAYLQYYAETTTRIILTVTNSPT